MSAADPGAAAGSPEITVAAALRAAVGRLAAAGLPEAGGDARALMAYALRVPRGQITLRAPDPLPAAAAVRFEAAITARLARRPVSRILGYRAFFGHRFAITDDVLDPRPETETLVEAALTAPFQRVLDLGTGSGAILLSLLAARPEARGLGTDLSLPALDVAQRNAVALGLAERAAFAQADWWAGLSGRFDLIVSNPPYIAAQEMSELAPEVLRHDPAVALSPGGDGLGAYRALLAGLGAHLAPGGRALFEIGSTQGPSLRALAAAHGFAEPRVLPDLDRRDRVLLLRAMGPADCI